jgi:hypothetical protein
VPPELLAPADDVIAGREKHHRAKGQVCASFGRTRLRSGVDNRAWP